MVAGVPDNSDHDTRRRGTIEDRVGRSARVSDVDEGVIVGTAGEGVAAAAASDRVVARVALNRVVVVAPAEIVVARVACDRVGPAATQDQVNARTAGEEVGLVEAADRGGTGEGGGVDRVGACPAGEQGDFDRRHGMLGGIAEERDPGVGERGVGIGDHKDRVDAAAIGPISISMLR